MKKSFYIVTITMATVLMAGIAMADSVDIGLGRMDRAEFETLRQMVSGNFQPSVSGSPQIAADTRVAEFNQRDVDAIRQVMVAGNIQQEDTASASIDGLVDIGTGSMATSEFCDLNKLVASNTTSQTGGFAFICP